MSLGQDKRAAQRFEAGPIRPYRRPVASFFSKRFLRGARGLHYLHAAAKAGLMQQIELILGLLVAVRVLPGDDVLREIEEDLDFEQCGSRNSA